MSNSDEIVNKALIGVFKANDRSIDNVKKQLGTGVKKQAKTKRNLNDIQLSTTVILVEVAASDETFQLSEYDTIADGLRQLYGTGREEAKKFINQALILRSSLSGNSRHLELLRDNLTEEEKLRIARVIDEIISADGQEDPYEIFLRKRYRRALGLSEQPSAPPQEEVAVDEDQPPSQDSPASESDDISSITNSSEEEIPTPPINLESSEPEGAANIEADKVPLADEVEEPRKAAPREHPLDILSKRIDEELY